MSESTTFEDGYEVGARIGTEHGRWRGRLDAVRWLAENGHEPLAMELLRSFGWAEDARNRRYIDAQTIEKLRGYVEPDPPIIYKECDFCSWPARFVITTDKPVLACHECQDSFPRYRSKVPYYGEPLTEHKRECSHSRCGEECDVAKAWP